MKPFAIITFMMFAIFLNSSTCLTQVKIERDTLYEKLKKKDINKMTQREYEYFMLMKRRK
jgi:DNA-binding NtrC family response regulator